MSYDPIALIKSIVEPHLPLMENRPEEPKLTIVNSVTGEQRQVTEEELEALLASNTNNTNK